MTDPNHGPGQLVPRRGELEGPEVSPIAKYYDDGPAPTCYTIRRES